VSLDGSIYSIAMEMHKLDNGTWSILNSYSRYYWS
jgi:hypothetical protein